MQSSSSKRSQSYLADLSAGTLTALVTLSFSISYGALIYSPLELTPFVSDGLKSALMSAWILALLVSLFSAHRFALAGPDSNATALLSVMSATLAIELAKVQAPAADIRATMLMMLMTSTLAVAAITFLVGALRLGGFVRYIPCPVIGGFMAGTGYLVVTGAWKVLTGMPFSFDLLFQTTNLTLLGGTTALLVFLGLQLVPVLTRGHYLAMPSVILAALVLFQIVCAVLGLDTDALRAQGILLQPIAKNLGNAGNGVVHWDLLLRLAPSIFPLAAVVILTILLNYTGLELAEHQDADFNRELRLSGLAMVASGMAGGMIGYTSLSRSLLARSAGGTRRLSGITAAILAASACFIFAPLLYQVPRPILAGLLFSLGFSLMRDWLWSSYWKLPRIEYALIVLICILIAAHGFLVGVSFGVLIAALIFVHNYSNASCIKHAFTCADYFSTRERSLEEHRQLKERGSAAKILVLQGYLFFGTANSILDLARTNIKKDGIKHLILDFRLVQGLDASALLAFTRIHQVASDSKCKLALSSLDNRLRAMFSKNGFLTQEGISMEVDLDHALETTEEALLSKRSAATTDQSLEEILKGDLSVRSLQLLVSRCTTIELQQGETLFRQGDDGSAFHFVEHGLLVAQLKLPSGAMRRLRGFGPGSVVGEMAAYTDQPRSADVIATCFSRIKCLERAELHQLEKQEPELGREFHHFVMRLMASRLASANQQVRVLS
jgi:sulfate permease, SulP family